MALFEKKVCAHCGKEVGVLSRFKLKDKSYVCFDCSGKCAKMLEEKFLGNITYPDFVDYLAQREENRAKLERFNITDQYFDEIFVDMDKGWFVFDKSKKIKDKASLLAMEPDVFDAKDLVFYDFFYIIKDVKQGIIHDKVKADVRLVIAFNNRWYPYTFDDKILMDYKHRAEITGMFASKASITENDKKLDLQMYLHSILFVNEIDVPRNLGGKLTMDFDFSPYDTYLRKLYELKKCGVYSSEDMDVFLKNITPSIALRHKLNKLYGKTFNDE